MGDQRKVAEQCFYDRAYESGTLDTKNGFYEQSASLKRFRDLIYAGVAGKNVLEYGCGLGGHAFLLADRGANVTGIDISEVAVAQAKHRAAGYSQGALTFMTADAENLHFPDNTFDLVCGTGILHHLDIARSLAEVKRVLKPGGRAVFYEPLGHNPLLNLYRRLTPGSHTADEHPLVKRDMDLVQDLFPAARAEYFDLFSIFVIPILRLPGANHLLRLMERLDRAAFRLAPPARWWGAVVVMELRT